jgi:hypothetical protein
MQPAWNSHQRARLSRLIICDDVADHARSLLGPPNGGPGGRQRVRSDWVRPPGRLSTRNTSADPIDPGLRENASLEELEAEIKKHFKRLAPVLDLQALMAPADEITTSDVPQGAAGR